MRDRGVGVGGGVLVRCLAKGMCVRRLGLPKGERHMNGDGRPSELLGRCVNNQLAPPKGCRVCPGSAGGSPSIDTTNTRPAPRIKRPAPTPAAPRPPAPPHTGSVSTDEMVKIRMCWESLLAAPLGSHHSLLPVTAACYCCHCQARPFAWLTIGVGRPTLPRHSAQASHIGPKLR